MQKHDVFISYAHLDNQSEWVSEFDRVFKTFLSTWLGRPANIWRDKSMGTGDYIWETIEDHLLKSRIMIPIISPSYLNSDWCSRELKTFIEQNRDDAGSKSAVFNIRRVPVEKENIPAGIRDVLENVLYREFFKREESGKVRIIAPDRGDELRKTFLNHLEDLAQDVYQTLQEPCIDQTQEEETGAKHDARQPFRGKYVFLSEPSPDLISEYLEIKRDFLNRGASLLPESILESKPKTIEEFEAKTIEQIKQCELVVHFVGSEDDQYSSTEDRSVVQTQIGIAAKLQEKHGFTRLVLLPKNVQPNTERHREFVSRLKETTSKNADLLRTTLDLKTQMEHVLLRESETPENAQVIVQTKSGTQGKTASIYLMFESEDKSLAENIAKKLFEKGCEVWTTVSREESAAEDLIEEHKWYLSNCDAVLVCWDKAKMFRARKLMSEFVSIMDNGRKKSFTGKGILINGSSPEKDSFMTHETIIRNQSELEEFVSKLKSGGENE